MSTATPASRFRTSTRDSADEAAEEWRVAGMLLQRIDPVAFDALLLAAGVIIAGSPDPDATGEADLDGGSVA